MAEKHARESTTEERVVGVFISSTFRDMHSERNELIKRIFPQLRKLCEERGVFWTDIDLRWGITEKQSRRGDVLPICFAEIRRCPYFIGILGERYGWVPDEIPQELIDQEPWLATHLSDSITELEILHGVLNHSEIANRGLFYFRDRAYIESLPSDQQPDYVELPTKDQIAKYGELEAKRLAEERQLKLLRLKQRIRASGAQVRENYPNPQALGELVLRDFTEIIVSRYKTAEIDPLDRQALDHESFARSRATVYIGRPKYFDRLDEHVASDGPPLVVLGASGSGKSAMLSNWALRYRNSRPGMFVLMHFIGATHQSADWAAMLRRIMAELKRKFDLEQEIPDQPGALRAAFMNCLHLAAAKGRIVLILDALNQLEDRENCLDLPWLPLRIPANVRLLLSTLPGRPLIEIQRRGWPTLDIAPLTPPERLGLSCKYLAQYAKRLNIDRLRRIATAEQSSNPLYLRALLDELRVFGIHEELDARIEHYLTATNVSELYEKILERYEQDYEQENPGLVREAMSMLWAARRGLSEAELLELLGTNKEPLPRAHWSPLYLAAEQSLVSRSGLVGFSHAYLREAVARLYLPTDADRQAAHRRLADYFEEQELYLHFEDHKLNHRKLNELPWQLAESKSWQQLGGLLADLPFLLTAHKYEAFELRSYWTQVEANSTLRMEETYRDIIENPQNHERYLPTVARLMTNAGRLKEGLRLWQYMTEQYRQSGDQTNFGVMLQNQAIALYYLGDPDSALTSLAEAEQIWRQLPYKRGLQATLGNIAAIRRSQADFSGAMAALNEQEQICRDLRALDGLALCLDNKSLVLKDQGNLTGSMLLLEEAGQICRQLGDLDLLQANLLNKAALLLLQEELDTAMVLLNEIEPLSRQTNDFNVLQAVLNNKSVILRKRGDLDGAMRLAEEQEHICRTRNLPHGLTTALANRAQIFRIRRNLDEALRLFQEAEQICRRLGNLNGVQICLGNRAAVLEDKMYLEEALALRNEQESISRSVGAPVQLAECLLGKAMLLAVPMGRGREADLLVDEADQLAQNIDLQRLIDEVERVRFLVRSSRMYEMNPLTDAVPRKSVSPRLRPSGLVSTAHPDADVKGETNRNIQYQKNLTCWKEELARWKALPLWKRFTIKKPEPPKGI